MNATSSPSYLDWYEITHWSWACCYQAERYLQASENSRLADDSLFDDISNAQVKRTEADLCYSKQTLAAYDFMSSVGVLLKILPRAKNLFPELKEPIENAKHIQTEGNSLRNMLVHAHDTNGYLRGKGREPDKFVRSNELYSADATSTVITEKGHLLGGRLLVELALAEINSIYQAAKKMPPPEDDGIL